MAKRFQQSESNRHASIFYGLASVVLVFAVLYSAKPVLVPLALGVLLTFILTPAVISLEKWHIPRLPAVLGVTFATFTLMFSIVWMTGSQIQSLASDLPNHQSEIQRKVAALKSGKDSTLNRLTRMFDEVTSDFVEKPLSETDLKSTAAGIPVVNEKPTADDGTFKPATIVVASDQSPLETVFSTLAPIVEPLASVALIVVLVIFLLINREDIRFRLLSLWGRGSLTGTTRLLTDASNRVSRYLLNLFLVNAAFGVWFGVGLYFIGVPYAPLWGFLTLVLRFIPFLGSPASVLFPLLISIATSQGWSEPIAVVIFFGVSELFVANVVEPILFGKTTGLSPIALLVAALFWAWLWGPIGLLLSTPLTVCLVVLGQYIPSLSWLKILLAEQSEMEPWLQYYQRLLSKDAHEAELLLKKNSDEFGPMKSFDEIIVPALNWTRQEREAGDIAADEAKFVWSTTRDLLVEEHKRSQKKKQLEQEAGNPACKPNEAIDGSNNVITPEAPIVNSIGYPAHHESEELTLAMLDQLLPDNYRFDIASTRSLPSQVLQKIESQQPMAVVVCVIPPGGLPQVEFFCEECRRRSPSTQIIVAYLGETEDYDKLLVDLRKAGASYLTTSLEQTINQMISIRKFMFDQNEKAGDSQPSSFEDEDSKPIMRRPNIAIGPNFTDVPLGSRQ